MSEQEDLEDGEIEDEEEDVPAVLPPVVPPVVPSDVPPVTVLLGEFKEFGGNVQPDELDVPRHHYRRKGGNRSKGKPAPVTDDWLTRVENSLAQVLKKDGSQPSMQPSVAHASDSEEDVPGGPDAGGPPGGTGSKGRKSQKRKKSGRGGDNHHHAPLSKQQRLDEPGDDGEMDLEYEMLNVRGSSPQDNHNPAAVRDSGVSDSDVADTHCSSDESRDPSEEQCREKQRERERDREQQERAEREQRRRDRDRERERDYNRKKRKQSRQRGSPKAGRDGRKRKRDDSDDEKHRPNVPRKMELCKFYLMDCCAKREKCLYMHKDFPCKYYYLGMKCKEKDNCLFSHGEPLADDLRAILLKHLETAPQEILGDFQRISRDNAVGMLNATHRKLMERYGRCVDGPQIPSLLDVPTVQPSSLGHKYHHKSRWADDNPPLDGETLDLLRQLTGVISLRQAQDLEQMGIRTLNEISQLTVAQLNELGLSITQIHDLQVRAMNMAKNREAKVGSGGVGNSKMDNKLEGPSESTGVVTPAVLEDVDLRKIAPISVPVVEVDTTERVGSLDVDMRVLPLVEPPIKESPKEPAGASATVLPDTHHLLLKPPTVDYSQYIKDSNLDEDLDAVAADTSCLLNDAGEDDDDDENHLKISIEDEEEEGKDQTEGTECPDERQLKRTDSDIDERKHSPLLLPPLVPPKIDYAQGLGDILMYGSLDKSSAKTISGASPRSHHRSPSPGMDEGNGTPSSSRPFPDAWTPSMSQSSSSGIVSSLQQQSPKPRSKLTHPASKGSSGDRQRRTGGSSLYDFYDSDNVPSSPDGPSSPVSTSFRYGSDKLPGSLDLGEGVDPYSRLGVAEASSELGYRFKSMMANYLPATEIDGSIGSHAPIHYKVYVVDVPKPNYKAIRRTTTRPVPSKDRPTDPRLRRLFGVQSDDDEGDAGTGSDAGIMSPDGSNPGASPLYNNAPPQVQPPAVVQSSAASPVVNNPVTSGPRIDPRKRHAEKQQQLKDAALQQQQPAGTAGGPAFGASTVQSPQIDVQAVLQKSAWYKDLGSKHKIMVNQQLAILSTEMKKYRNSDRSTERLSEFMQFLGTSNILQQILTCLNVFVDDSVSFCEVPLVPNLPPPSQHGFPMVPHIPPPTIPSQPMHVPPPMGVQGPPMPGTMSHPPPTGPQGVGNAHAPPMFGHGPQGQFGRPQMTAGGPLTDQQPPMLSRPGLLGMSPNMPFEQFLAMGNVNKGEQVSNGPPVMPWTQGNIRNNNGNHMRNMRNDNRIGHNFRNNNDRWNNNGGDGPGSVGPPMMMGGNNGGAGGQGNNRRNNNRRKK